MTKFLMSPMLAIPYAGFQNYFEKLTAPLGWGHVPATIIAVIVPIAFVAVYALVAVYAERKVSAFMQDRLGPMEVGPYGVLQTAADILKLLVKEDIVPKAADKILFTLAPITIFTAVFAGFAALPFGPAYLGAWVNVGVFYILSIVSIDVVGLLMAGWGSNNKYALYGSIRSVSQIISYEIPASLAILCAVVTCGTLDLQAMTYQQGILSPEPVSFLGFLDVKNVGGFLAWNIFRSPVLFIAFIIYFISSLAECNRAPFDIPEAESELVAGFHIEYGGFKFAVIFLAEYAMMFIVGVIISTVFLGGWNTMLPNLGALKLATWTTGPVWGVFWILAKASFMVFVHMWLRWTLPRFRVDQLMGICWRVLTPIGFGCLLIATLWRLMTV